MPPNPEGSFERSAPRIDSTTRRSSREPARGPTGSAGLFPVLFLLPNPLLIVLRAGSLRADLWEEHYLCNFHSSHVNV